MPLAAKSAPQAALRALTETVPNKAFGGRELAKGPLEGQEEAYPEASEGLAREVWRQRGQGRLEVVSLGV